MIASQSKGNTFFLLQNSVPIRFMFSDDVVNDGLLTESVVTSILIVSSDRHIIFTGFT